MDEIEASLPRPQLARATPPNFVRSHGYSVRYSDFAYDKATVIAPDYEVLATCEDAEAGFHPAVDWRRSYAGPPLKLLDMRRVRLTLRDAVVGTAACWPNPRRRGAGEPIERRLATVRGE